MRLSPDMLAAAYDLLRHTKPFDGWNLPEPEDVTFGVIKGRRIQGDCRWMGDRWRIRISESWHGRLSAMLGTVGHEMIHLHLGQCGAKDSSDHGVTFKAMAAQALAEHRDFDPETF